MLNNALLKNNLGESSEIVAKRRMKSWILISLKKNR